MLTAPGDGVAPAVLLTLSGGGASGGPHSALQKAQYLFGAPEGISRLALEHQVRPGLHLRALFAADVRQSLGGAGGLIMRLRGEGHGRLHVVGPPGALW